MRKPVKSHVFRGKRYAIKRVPPSKAKDYYGKCNPPDKPCKALVFDNTLKDKFKLEIEIHEALHALFFDMSEETVTEAAEDLTKFLWRLGYREQEDA